MSKEDFISVFETTLICANLDVVRLSLADNNTALVKSKGSMIVF